MKKIHLDVNGLQVESFATYGSGWTGLVVGQGSGLGCSTGCSETNPVDPSISADGQCVCQENVGP